jgi:hypothetical protein
VTGMPKMIQDPEKFSLEVFGTPVLGKPAEMSKQLAEALGIPDLGELEKAFRFFEGKKADVFAKVIDNQFGGALRQIMYYACYDRVGFFYFCFNFKLTGKGWLIAHFNLNNEVQRLFPKDLIGP